MRLFPFHRPGPGAFVTCLSIALLLGALPASAQEARVAGRPFVRIAQANRGDTVAGFISGFGRAQLVGNEVVFATRDSGTVTGVFRGRGGNTTVAKVVGPGMNIPGGVAQVFHDAFVRDTATGPGIELVVAAGVSRADGLYRVGSDPITELLAPGRVLPNSGGLVLNTLGEPNWVGGNLAVIGWHTLAGNTGVGFRGVYRVEAGALVPVSDTATSLPGGFGVPESFSSQVGFDGGTLAFWAARGPFGAEEGIFAQDAGGPVRMIARNGDLIPGAGAIDGFISPPAVSGGVVYFFAYEASRRTHLLKSEGGVITRLAGDDDLTPTGTPLSAVGQFGLAAANGAAWFPAQVGTGAGLFRVSNGVLDMVIPPNVTVGGIRPSMLVLQDLDGDTVVLESIAGSTRYLVANLAQPAPPVVIEEPADVTVAGGATVELRVGAVGDGPLTYQWRRGGVVVGAATGPVLRIEAAGAADVGSYQVTVSNALGTVNSRSALVNVQVPPVIVSFAATTSVETGDALVLQPVAIGGLPLSYSWTRDGNPVTSDSPALGIFVRTAAGPADAGSYRLTVSNAFGNVTSDPMQVTVTPPAPNPVYGGFRFVPVLSGETRLPGVDALNDASVLGEFSARWFGEEIVFQGRVAGGVPAGLYSWANGTLRRLIAIGRELPNGLGGADDIGVIQGATAGAPMLVTANRPIGGFSGPAGVFRLADDAMTSLVDVGTDVPGTVGAKFPAFYQVAQGGGRIATIAVVSGVPGLYLSGPEGHSRLLAGTDTLPVVGKAATQFQGHSIEGDQYTLVASTAGLQQQVALLGGFGVAPSALLKMGDAIPGTSQTVRSFGPTEIRDGQVFLLVFDQSFGAHVLHWQDGTMTRIAGSGMAVAGVGTIQSLEASFTKASAGRAHLAARITTPTGVQRGVVAAGTGGIAPVLMTRKLDARRIGLTAVVAAEGDRLILLVTFEGGGRALYANVGAVSAEVPNLSFARPNPGLLRLAVPSGTGLEWAPAIVGPWETMQGNGEVEVNLDAATGERFYRLRRTP